MAQPAWHAVLQPRFRQLTSPLRVHVYVGLPRVCRVQTTAADWIGANLEGGPVVKEKFVGGSNWSSAYVYTTQGWQAGLGLLSSQPWPCTRKTKAGWNSSAALCTHTGFLSDTGAP